MRKALLVVLLSLVPLLAHAQPNQTASIFLSDVMQNQTDRLTERWPSGFGASFERMVAPRWSLQGAVAVEQHHSYAYIVDENGGIVLVDSARLRTVPVDLTARYHWLNDTRWKPYLG